MVRLGRRIHAGNVLLIILAICAVFSLEGQQEFRQFDINDSTEYVLNTDTTIVVSKYRIYHEVAGELSLIYDFSTADPNRFILDFDIVTDDFWYVIFGGKNWGGTSILYKTTDKGLSWIEDTSIFEATKEPYDLGLIGEETLYQLHTISEDTLILFISYYQSGIFYTVDSGQSWNLWFANAPANYRGLIECGDSYFLWGQEGDGFRGSMFGFDSSLLLSPDTSNVWSHLPGINSYHPDCFNGVNPECIFVANSLSGYEQYLFFENYIEENCDDLTRIELDRNSEYIQIFPNPSANGKLTAKWGSESPKPVSYKIYTLGGQLINSAEIHRSDSVDIDLADLGQTHGIYFFVLEYTDKVICRKIVY